MPLWGWWCMIPAVVLPSKPLSGCIEQPFAISLNDLPINSGDK